MEDSVGEPRLGRVAGHLAIIAILLGLSVWMLARVWITGHPTNTVLCQCGDPGQAVWFMSWVPYAIAHGHNPLFTTRMLAGQGGANLLQSTSYLLPSFLLAPVTWLFGATASFNVAETLAPVLSGWTMYLASGRMSRRWLARAAAAVSYGFCPFLVGSVFYGHLNFSWLFFPPLLFLLLHEILVGDRLKPITAGVLLGLLLVAQFFTGTEPLLITAMAAVPGLVCAFAVAPKSALARSRRILSAAGAALTVAVVVLAYPLWYLARGRRHVAGVPWPGTSVFGNPLGSIVHSGAATHSTSEFLRVGGYYGVAGPNGSYLGIGMLVVVGLAIPLFVVWRRRVAWPVLVSGVAAWLCSLGTFLLPLSADSKQWWLPWKYLNSLPLVQNIGPQRFGFVAAACAALLFALALDCWADALVRLAGRLTSSGGRGVLAVSSVVLLGLVALVGLPVATQFTFPLTMNSGQVPVWFVTMATRLPAGTRVLTYPYASSAVPDAMYWQAHDVLGFALVGGRALIPGADGRHSQHVDPLKGTNGLLTNDSFGLGAPPAPTPVQIRALRASLHHWGVNLVVVVARGRAPAWAIVWFAEALGRVPVMEHDAAVFDVGKERGPPVILGATAANRCAAEPVSPGGLQAATSCLVSTGRFR